MVVHDPKVGSAQKEVADASEHRVLGEISSGMLHFLYALDNWGGGLPKSAYLVNCPQLVVNQQWGPSASSWC